MAEENNVNSEETTLNAQNLNPEWGDTAGNEGNEKKVYTAEEVEAIRKEMQANGDRWVQKLLDEQRQKEQFKETVIDEIALISADPQRMIELSVENLQVAEFILKKYFWGKSIEEYAKSYNLKPEDTPKVQELNVKKEAERLYNERVISEKTEEFVKELKMSDEERADFEKAFAERRELKSFSVENLRTHLEKAYREVSPVNNPDLKNTETLARATATGSGKDSSATKAKTEAQKEVEEMFQKYRPIKK